MNNEGPYKPNPKLASLDRQVGGDYYKNMPIQPVEYITRNNIPYIEGAVIKYVSRHRNKGGSKDIQKAIHFLELLLELEYPDREEI